MSSVCRGGDSRIKIDPVLDARPIDGASDDIDKARYPSVS